MTEEVNTRDFSPTTLHLNPLTGTPYSEINQYTYDFLAPEIKKLYRLNPSRLTYSYFGRETERK